MTSPHFFADDVAADHIKLAGEEARHAVRVLRIRPGEEITVSDGRGSVAVATVVEAGSELIAEVKEHRSDPRPIPRVHVLQAIPKAGKLELVVQKLTELGIDVVRPFPADRSVSRWSERKASDQIRRLTAIAREASKQARRSWLPEILPPLPLSRVELASPSFVLHEESTARLGTKLPPDPPETITLVIGPEGGLTPDEVSMLVGMGGQAVSLGPLVLRTETASLVAAVAVLGRYGRIG